MARKPSDLNQFLPVDSDYPDGDLKDNTTGNNGTVVDRKMISDSYQFFLKLMREAGITPNSLPDNDYNGYQLFESFLAIGRRYGQRLAFNDSGLSPAQPSFSVNPNYNPLILISPGTSASQSINLLPFNAGGLVNHLDLGAVTIKNNSSNTVEITTGININYSGSGSYNLAAGKTVLFVLDKTGVNYDKIQEWTH